MFTGGRYPFFDPGTNRDTTVEVACIARLKGFQGFADGNARRFGGDRDLDGPTRGLRFRVAARHGDQGEKPEQQEWEFGEFHRVGTQLEGIRKAHVKR